MKQFNNKPEQSNKDNNRNHKQSMITTKIII